MVKETRVQRKNRRLRLYRGIALLIVIAGVLIFWSLRTSLLDIKTITVEGTSILSSQEIMEASGVVVGENIIKANIGSGEKKVTELPYIETADIKRKLPGTVNIKVQERRPYLQFAYNYSYAIVDPEGVLLEYSIRRNNDIPLVKGLDWAELKAGDSLTEKPLGESLLDFFNDQEIEEIVLNFREIEFDEEKNIKINLFSGVTVEFGPLYNVKYKLKVLQEIIEDVEEKNIPTKMIIMNKGEHPIVVRDEK
ncbi:cell division protein FtsQ/DivIB [Gudongella sp. SC589]|uniref:cell division protein FtsQ/DivIB n=1 Tax=Gudongella sp. SC589 TaxID=3385990 RepID=UPI003904D273